MAFRGRIRDKRGVQTAGLLARALEQARVAESFHELTAHTTTRGALAFHMDYGQIRMNTFSASYEK